jgi:HAD superfamily hydrolase (TIGR01509 family)
MTKAILFDLDGTLLSHHVETFLARYLRLVGQRFAESLPGVDVPRLVLASSQVMLRNDGSRTNEEAFWSDFAPRFDRPRTELEAMFTDFYRRDFPQLGADIAPEPAVADAVAACREQRLRLAVATNPVFPRLAIDERLRWAGLDSALFDRVTSYEWMRYCKPHPGYFRQLAEDLGEAPADCLMVGNDVGLDLQPAAATGMHTCLVSNAYQVAAAGFRPDHTCSWDDLPGLARPSTPTR